MGLETATYIAGLNESWPDGLDQAATLDNHIRLLKAVLKRQFPNLDGPVSLSAIGSSYLNDLTASVQYQLNNLRDGSHTAVAAINSRFANSASVANDTRAVGGVSASYIAAVSYTNIFAVVQQFGGSPFGVSGTAAVGFTRIFPGSAAVPAYYAWYTADGTRRGYMGYQSPAFPGRMQIAAENGWGWDFASADGTALPPTINGQAILHASSSLNASNLGLGSIPDARVPLSAVQQHQASLNVNSALTAGSATSATTASNALTLQGFSPDANANANTVAVRAAGGYLYAGYFNMTGPADGGSLLYVMGINTSNDGFIRKSSLANLGNQLETRNITGRSGTAKVLQAGVGPPVLAGYTNGDLFYYY